MELFVRCVQDLTDSIYLFNFVAKCTIVVFGCIGTSNVGNLTGKSLGLIKNKNVNIKVEKLIG